MGVTIMKNTTNEPSKNDALQKKRRSHSSNFDQVRLIFRDNILQLFARDETAQTDDQLSVVFNVNPKTISAWKKGTQLPRAETLMLICDRYNVTVDWLLGKKSAVPKPMTYSSAFLRLQSLHDLMSSVTLRDPFLSFMVQKNDEIHAKQYLSRELIDEWKTKFLQDLDIPIRPHEVTVYIEPGLKIYSQLEDYDSYVTCLRRMSHYIRYRFSQPFIEWALRDSGKKFREEEKSYLHSLVDKPYYPTEDENTYYTHTFGDVESSDDDSSEPTLIFN